MKRAVLIRYVCRITAGFMLWGVVTGVFAERRSYAVSNEKWVSECGACHLPYPPQLLSAESWRAVMKGLDRHFGVDASVDALTAHALQAFAEANSATGKSASGPTTLRITDTRWFQRKHDELPAGVWKRPAIRSAGNCVACHNQADRGIYSEHTVRVPR
jgi:nitrate/TMAO reductase-like tetraheme cytochrome c subunit